MRDTSSLLQLVAVISGGLKLTWHQVWSPLAASREVLPGRQDLLEP
ncbi:MAG TPA: hypothetical protein PLR25_26675 [Planctomycetaceae bacterium]|nr:hypothetical protein [Planctomycetaceae bacterium]